MSQGPELAGKTAIVTGGARGMGRAIVERFARAGARVVFTSRNPAEGQDVEAAVAKAGGAARFIAADQASDADWSKVIAAVDGALDILVLNAGVSTPTAIPDMSLEAFRASNDINLKGVFLGLKHGVEAIRLGDQGGSVMIVASVVGKVGAPGFSHYTAGKAGVRMMAKAAALELGAEHIRVNSIHPGFVRTKMTEGFDETVFAPMIPLGRFGDPEDIAGAALFLASERSKFMTGAELVVDGGWIAQ